MFIWRGYFWGVKMSSNDPKDEHIHIVVRGGQKDRWTEHAQEYDYDSRSTFVREAAENQYDRDITGGAAANAAESITEEVLVQLEGMEATLRLLNENLDNGRENQMDDEMIDDVAGGYARPVERQIKSLENPS